jgi:predicted dehydrogenase
VIFFISHYNSFTMKLAILGLGFMGSTHLRAARAAAGVELAAVCSGDDRKLAGDLTSVGGNLGGPSETVDLSGIKKYRRVEQVLADPVIDAVDICLPTDLHAATTIDALRAGKHVLVEKPMSLDGPSADRMIEEAERQRRILMTAQVVRFFPQYEALHEALRSGRLGRVRAGVFRRRCAVPEWSAWLGEAARSGGGLFDLLIHDVDFCLHLLGHPRAVSATGWQDVLSAQLFYEDGVAITIAGGWFPGPVPFAAGYTVALDGGTMELAGGEVSVWTKSPEDAAGIAGSARREQDGYAAEIAYFAQCCNEGRAPELCPPRESADAVKGMLLILEARKRNGEKIEWKL